MLKRLLLAKIYWSVVFKLVWTQINIAEGQMELELMGNKCGKVFSKKYRSGKWA